MSDNFNPPLPPPEPPPEPRAVLAPPSGPLGLLGTGGVLALFILEFLGASILAVVVWSVAVGPPATTGDLINGDFVSLNTIIFAALVWSTLAVLFFFRRSHPPGIYLALRPPPWKTLPLWVGLIVAFSLGGDQVLEWFHVNPTPEWMDAIYQKVNCRACLLFAVLVIAPLTEEVIFRGFVFAGVENKLGKGAAVIVTALIWALMHMSQYEWPYLILIFGLGLALGVARMRTRSLWVPWAMHVTNNLLASLQLWVGP